jgi:F-type H+-transporting ATPase subunit b
MTAIWTIIIFLVLLVILRATAWKPIQKVLTERENFIRDSLAQAKADREAAEARLKEYAAKLDAAQKEAAAILEVGRRDAAAVKHRIEQDAKEEADRTIERAKREIGIASDNAVKDLYTLSAKLGTEIASRVIQKELNPADHERLIADSIKEFQAAARN